MWAQERPAFGSRVLDEFYGPDSPVAQPTLFLRTNLLAATNGLTLPGESDGRALVSLPTPGGALVLVLAGLAAPFRRARRVPAV